jgi:hypothetical protein
MSVYLPPLPIATLQMNLHLVLMSATVDIKRHTSFFEDAGLTVKTFALSLPPLYTNDVFYLDHIKLFTSSLLSRSRHSESEDLISLESSLMKKVQSNFGNIHKGYFSSRNGRPSIVQPNHQFLSCSYFELIRDLIYFLHRCDANLRNGILVFLPTYSSISTLMGVLREGLRHWREDEIALFTVHGLVDFREDMRSIEMEKKKRYALDGKEHFLILFVCPFRLLGKLFFSL